MPKYTKTKDELEAELVEQVKAFRVSISGYDKGDLWEAKRMAASIYIMANDGGRNTKSLLGILGMKSNLKLPSSAVYPEIPPLPRGCEQVGEPIFPIPTAMVMLYNTGTDTEFRPRCECDTSTELKRFPLEKFTKWWDEDVFTAHSKIGLSRKNLICTVRDKDGGGHVDDHLDNLNYRILKTVGTEDIKKII